MKHPVVISYLRRLSLPVRLSAHNETGWGSMTKSLQPLYYQPHRTFTQIYGCRYYIALGRIDLARNLRKHDNYPLDEMPYG